MTSDSDPTVTTQRLTVAPSCRLRLAAAGADAFTDGHGHGVRRPGPQGLAQGRLSPSLSNLGRAACDSDRALASGLSDSAGSVPQAIH